MNRHLLILHHLSGRPRCFTASLLLALSGPLLLAAADAGPGWKTTVRLSAKEAYDSNVFLQDTAPNPAVTGAAPARLASLVSQAVATFALEGRPAPGVTLSAGYAPEVNFYHAAHTEDFIAHRTTLGLSGGDKDLSWSLANSAAWIDGSKDAPIYGGPGGAPAMGGAAVRDRRDAFVERGSFKLTALSGPWLLRATAAAYWHDFQTQQTRLAGCSNYIDRSELTAGLDAGYALRPGTRLLAGFRYGRQQQGDLLGTDSPYDSWLRRFLVGLEGSPVQWLQLSLLAGFETRTFATGTPAGFDRHHALLWVDAAVSATPTKRDTFTACFRRTEQPSSSSVSVYVDLAAELTWRHQCTEKFSAGAGCRLAGGDWRAPAVRQDRIYSPGLQLSYAASPRCRLEFAAAIDVAQTLVAATAGRAFHRQSVSLTCSLAL